MAGFIPDDYDIPQRLEGEGFYLRPLTIDDSQKDFEAVMANKDRLTSPNEANTGWPHTLTPKQNTVDVAWHHKEFQNATSFAYTIFTNDEKDCLGSVYIYPTDKGGYDAKVEMWAREDTQLGNIDDALFKLVQGWINNKWPFENPAFVGIEIPRDAWEAMPSSGAIISPSRPTTAVV